MDEAETSHVPCSLSLLVDPAQAMLAAQRLYAAPGGRLCHSGWSGRTASGGRAAALQTRPASDGADDDDDDDD